LTTMTMAGNCRALAAIFVLLGALVVGDKTCTAENCPDGDSARFTCVKWRQTGGCSPDGKREKHGDKACSETVPGDASGYCECGGGVKVRKVGCGHSTFRCGEECAMQDRYKCVSWRQTGDCSADGPRETDNDKDCTVRIDAGASGYCECGAGRRIKRAGCQAATDSDSFTCAEECADEVDLYEVLGLETLASMQQVKQAFRRLSVKYHPDKVTTNKEQAKLRFAELRTAYDVLGDASKKMHYDMGGSAPADGKALEKAQQMKGGMPTPLEHFYNGHTFTTHISRRVICRGCANKHTTRCSACNQQCPNEIKTVQIQMGPMLLNQRQEVASNERCKDQNTPIEVTVEKGMRAGSEIQYPALGEQRPGMIPGDLTMTLQPMKHHIFEWKGHDLHMVQKISLKEALLGFKKEIRHLDGRTVYLESTGIVAPSEVLTLKGQGMPKEDPTEFGDLHAELRFEMPTALSRPQKDWLQSSFPN